MQEQQKLFFFSKEHTHYSAVQRWALNLQQPRQHMNGPPHPNVAATQFAEYKKTNIKVYSKHYVLNIVLDNFSFSSSFVVGATDICYSILSINYSTAYLVLLIGQ